MKKILLFLLLAGCVVFLGAAVYQTLQARDFRDQALRADSAAAEADTARLLALAALDSTETAYQRRIVQTELRLDSLDRELRQRPVIRIAAEVRVDTLRFTDTVFVTPTTDSTDTKNYDFDGTDPPFGFRGQATIFPNDQGIFNVNVFQVDPIPIHARVTCGDEEGIRSASILFTATDPFSIIPGRVEQDPSVCNPRRRPLLEFSGDRAAWAGGGAVLGVIIAHLLDDGFRKARYD